MENYPHSVNKESHKIIMNYLDNSIYKIKRKDGKFGIGFFCYIKYHNRKIPILITNYKIIDDNYYHDYNSIDILINSELIKIEFGSLYYIDKYLDLSIIEIKENKKINILDIDDCIYKDESEIFLAQESIYIIHYNNYNNICVSYGVIKDKTKSELKLMCNIKANSNCYPIFNLSTNQLIGIYTKNSKYYSTGIYFKYIIKQFKYYVHHLTKFKINNNKYKNEINIKININKEDIGKNIYFLDNKYKDKDLIYSSHDNLKELNELNTELYINEKKEKFKKYFIPIEEGIYNINIKFNINLTDCSYMFSGCGNIININFISFNTNNVENMKYMFYGCKNLKYLNLFSFNAKNVIDMSHMFQ